MSGSVPGFNADEVRAGLRLAMTIGLPVEDADQPVFFMPRVSTASTPAVDAQGVPFDAEETRTFAPPQQIKVPCAIEYHSNEGKIENFGLIVPDKVVLTLLDQEYEQVKGFEFVVIGGNRFFYKKTAPPLGLVSVGVYQIHCVSEDQA